MQKAKWRADVIEILDQYWILVDRPDLFRDVVDHILSVYPEQNGDYLVIIGEAFEFLQTRCNHAISSEDINNMADEELKKEWISMAHSFEE